MTVPSRIGPTLALVRHSIEVALAERDSNLFPLLERLDLLRAGETSAHDGRSDVVLELSIWVKVIREALPMASQELVAQMLVRSRGDRPARDDVWAELDPMFVAHHEETVANTWIKAGVDALECCRRYAENLNPSFLRSAVVRLERASAIERALRPRAPTIRGSRHDRQRLRMALDDALPPDAVAFLVRCVRSRIGGAGSGGHHLTEERWMNAPGIYLRELGDVFTPDFQSSYDDAREAEQKERDEHQRQVQDRYEAMIAPTSEAAPPTDGSIEAEEEGEDSDGDGPTKPTQIEIGPCAEETRRTPWVGLDRWAADREQEEADRRLYFARLGRPYPGPRIRAGVSRFESGLGRAPRW